MDKIRTLFVALSGGLAVLAAAPPDARADDGGGLNANLAQVSWSRWQARVSFGRNPSSPGSDPAANDSRDNGLNLVRRPGGTGSFSLLGDYYFARPFDSAGGLRATSGLIVGPRSQGLSIAQPNLSAGAQFSVDSRGFGQPSLLRSRDTTSGETTAAVPYIGLGYTGRAAGGALSLSADVGMLGQSFGDAQGRFFGTGLRNLDESGRDSARLLPVLQLGMLYSF